MEARDALNSFVVRITVLKGGLFRSRAGFLSIANFLSIRNQEISWLRSLWLSFVLIALFT